MKGVMRFGKKEKLAPRHIGQFEILQRVGVMAYKLALPPQLSGIHNVFHLSMFQKYERDASHIIHRQLLDIREDVMYIEQSVCIINKKDQVLRTKIILLVKVQWGHHGEEEAS
ncbi:uncharacterized protein LOC131226957 [Magnolia sinica]|uniref:uncharacterized protein LOC131226957 n=1 Tax=Magnolia sinica TaxID=86752 RepID=UPI00265924D3|nr:uncharacterized protein LOC131226957 [Magnolia sinica]